MNFGKLSSFLVLFSIVLAIVPMTSAAVNEPVVIEHNDIQKLVSFFEGWFDYLLKSSETHDIVIIDKGNSSKAPADASENIVVNNQSEDSSAGTASDNTKTSLIDDNKRMEQAREDVKRFIEQHPTDKPVFVQEVPKEKQKDISKTKVSSSETSGKLAKTVYSVDNKELTPAEEEIAAANRAEYGNQSYDASEYDANVSEEDANPGVAPISSDKQKKLDQVTLSREATKVYVKNVTVAGSRAEVEFAFVGKYSHPVESSERPFNYEYELPGELSIRFLDESGNDVGGFQISTLKFTNGTVKVIDEDCLSGETPTRMVASIYGNEVYSMDISQQSMASNESYEITDIYQPKEGNIAFDVNVSNWTPSYTVVHPVYVEFRDNKGELVSPSAYFFEIIPEGNCGMSPSFANIPKNLTKGWVELRNVDGKLLSKMKFDFNK